MKKTTALLTVLIVMAVLFASCSHGGGSSDGTAKVEAVNVTLSLEGEAANVIQKAVALNKAGDSLTYWIKAESVWTNNTESIKASKPNTFTQINYEAGVSLGLFTSGKWTFSAQIKNGENVIYEGSKTVVISPTNSTVTIDMEMYDDDSTGSILIKVAVPTVDTTKLFVKYDNGDETLIENPTPDTIVNTAGVTTSGTGWTYFTTSNNTLTPGNHTVNLIYKDGDREIGGATVTFTVRNGDSYGLYGTVQNGPWQQANLTLVLPVITLNVSAITYSQGSASITAIANAAYAWYVNGKAALGATNSNSYAFGSNYTAPGEYWIKCVATKGDAIGEAFYIATINE